jgi:putative inorganic carbon (HCO3(-)) transporter
MKEISLPSLVVMSFGGLALLGLLMVGVQDPRVPLYVLVAYLPFSLELVGDFGTQATALNMTNILILWVPIGHVASCLSRNEPLMTGTSLSKVIGLFCLLGAIALMRGTFQYGSWYLTAALTPLKRWLTPMLLYFLALWVARDKRTLKTVVVIIMVAVTVAAVMAIREYMWISGGSFDSSRVGGIAGHSNTLGAFFNYYMFLFAGYFLVYVKRPKAWWLLVPFLLCFRGIMVTFSRGAYLAFAAGSLATCFFQRKLLFVCAVFLGLLALANPVLLPAGIRYRMGMTVVEHAPGFEHGAITESLEGSAATRIEIWRGAVKMIKAHPWWGVGYGAFPRFIPRYTDVRVGHLDAHNSYLLIASEMGVPTLLVFLLILCMVWHYTRWLYRHTEDRSMKAMALGFLGGLTGLLVANIFGSRMDAQVVSGYFWVLSGLIMRGVLIERQDQRSSIPSLPSIPSIPSFPSVRSARHES